MSLLFQFTTSIFWWTINRRMCPSTSETSYHNIRFFHGKEKSPLQFWFLNVYFLLLKWIENYYGYEYDIAVCLHRTSNVGPRVTIGFCFYFLGIILQMNIFKRLSDWYDMKPIPPLIECYVLFLPKGFPPKGTSGIKFLANHNAQLLFYHESGFSK